MDKNRKNTLLDDKAREALKNLEASYNPQHWDMMEQRLRDMDNAETAFDAHIKNNVEQLQKSYQSKHWEMMSQRLDEEFSWKSKIVRYKLVEVALMLLLIATGINYYENDFNFSIKKHNTPRTDESKQLNAPENWRNRSSEYNSNKKTVENKTNPIASVNNKSAAKASSTENRNYTNSLNAFVYNNLNTTDNFNIKTDNTTSEKQPQDVVLTEGGQINVIKNAFDALPSSKNIKLLEINTNLPNIQYASAKDKKRTIAVVEPIDKTRSKALTITQMIADKTAYSSQKKSKLWLSMFGIGSLDKLYTSFIDRGRVNKRDTFSYNVGHGLSLDYRLGKWGIQSGVSVSKKTFAPKIRALGGSLSRGYYEEKIQSLEFEMASVPLNINYHFLNTPKWSLYSQLGASFNAILYAKENREFTGSFSNGGVNALRSYSSDYVLNKYSAGLFEKPLLRTDALTDIHYFTANLGIGAEYKISPIFNFYTEASMYRHIGRPSIGTLSDRINTYSIQAGLRVNLSKGNF